MMELFINKFQECRQCGICCNSAPCELIPEDLPRLLEHFNMDLSEFFQKYLITLPLIIPNRQDIIFMMVPVRVNADGSRTKKLLADNEYLQTKGRCIFFNNNKCDIHEVKPHGGRIMQCPNITGLDTIQFHKNTYYIYWYNNQHLFKEIFPHRSDLFDALRELYIEAGARLSEYYKTRETINKLFNEEIYKCFNGASPINGWHPLGPND